MVLTVAVVLRKIEVADSLESLKTIEEDIQDKKFSETETEQIHQALIDREREIIGDTKKRLVENPPSDLLFKSSLYDRDDSKDLPSYRTLYSDGMDYLNFLKEIYFKEFVYVPDSHIQVPILSACLFLNSMTIPDRCRLPLIYLYSPTENSGKSTILFHFGYHYPRSMRLYYGQEITGAGLRNDIAPIASLDQPCLVQLDNYNAVETNKRLQSIGISILLKYTRMEAARNIIGNVEGGTEEFNSHSLKILSSVTPLGRTVETGSEVRSRCLTFFCEASKGLQRSVDSFNWDDCQKEYYDVWGDPDRANRIYKKGILKELLQMSSKDVGIYNRQWLLSISVISVGVFAGVWRDIDEGIKALRDYWEWESGRRIVKMSPIEALITEYTTKLHPKLVEDERIKCEGTSITRILDPNFIRLSELYNYLSKVKKSVQRQTYFMDKQVSDIMFSLGYASRVERHKSTGESVDIQFYKL